MNDTSYALPTGLVPRLAPQDVKRAMDMIERAQRIALLAHERPDGDCIGSALGFAHILRLAGKTCTPACADAPPRMLSFLPAIETFRTSLEDEQFDLVIALDAGELTRFGTLYTQHKTLLERTPILNIDHHISSSGCGVVNIIEPAAAATAELIVLFQQQAGLPINTDAAQCLLTGIITDTASFQYSSTTPRTMEAGAYLLHLGAVPETIVQPIYRTHTLAQMRFQAAVISQARVNATGELIWSYATDEMLWETGATAEMDDNFSGMLRDIEGVRIAAFFKNYGEPTRTRLSLRCAEPYNAATFCMRLGGGGHARAAGATIDGPLEVTMPQVVAQLEQFITEYAGM